MLERSVSNKTYFALQWQTFFLIFPHSLRCACISFDVSYDSETSYWSAYTFLCEVVKFDYPVQMFPGGNFFLKPHRMLVNRISILFQCGVNLLSKKFE